MSAGSRRKGSHSFDLRHMLPQVAGKLLHVGVALPAIDFEQQGRVVVIGEKLNFIDALWRPALPANLPEPRDHLINRRRADRALLYWQQLVGIHAVIAKRKILCGHNLHTRAVAIVPRFSRVEGDFIFPVEFSSAPEALTQYAQLDSQLVRIIGVLIMAAAAGTEIRTRRLHPSFGWLEQFVYSGPHEAALFFDDGGGHLFTRKDQGDKDSFALRAAGQPITAINHFFNGKVHR